MEEVLSGHRSFKSIVNDNDRLTSSDDEKKSNVKVEYFLAAQTLKNKPILMSLISSALQMRDNSNMNTLFEEVNRGVFLVMIYELLFSAHQRIHGGVRAKFGVFTSSK